MSTRATATLLLCLCCLAGLAALVQASSSSSNNKKNNNNAAKSAAAMAKDAPYVYKMKKQDKYQRQRQAAEMVSGGSHIAHAPIPGVAKMPRTTKRQKNLTKSAHGLNKKLLNKMGFIKVKAPNSHNRKRLAVESRRHASRDDSHMFIIKLPANLHYYTSPNSAAKNAGAVTSTGESRIQSQSQSHDNAQKSAMDVTTKSTTEASALMLDALKTNGKKVSFPFSSNGRPGRIYHWNLPVLKQALNKKPHFAHVSSADRNRLLDIKDIPTWRKPWENDTAEKSFTAGSGKSKYKKSLKPKSPTYYAPAQAVNQQSFHKYFAGNGKPKGLFVIKEHQTKPLFYQNIIS